MRTFEPLLLAGFFLLAVCLPRVVSAQARTGEPAVSVVERREHVEVDTGRLRFALGTWSNATLRWVELDGRRLVDGNDAPLLSARLMESATWDGNADFTPDRRFLDGNYVVDSVEHSVEGARFTALLTGRLGFSGGDGLLFQVRVAAAAGDTHLTVDVKLEAEGEFRNRFVRDIALRLPLTLEWRKRIAQGGDQGLEWDTRYYYEFPARSSGILANPDRNEFRYFGVEQDSPHHFRAWRAESATTPELVHQHGVAAAGWTSVYDRAGGVLFALRGMAAAAPKTLEVDAAGGGEARVLLYPETAPAFSPADTAAAGRVFGAWHATDWVFYQGEHSEAKPDIRLAELWGRAAPLSGARPAGPDDLWDAGLELWTAPPAADGRSPYVSGGVPLARGRMQPNDGAAVSGLGGIRPCQTRSLAFWPDGSVKWLHLVFPLEGGGASGADIVNAAGAEPFEVTLRDGSWRGFELYYGPRVAPARAETTVAAIVLEQADDGGLRRLRVDTGPLQAEIALGEHWLPEAALGGTRLWRPGAGGVTAFVDFLRADGTYPARSTHPAGAEDPGPVVVESLALEEAGPLRAVVRLQGRALSREPTDVVMRLEFFAGRAWVRLSHSVEFTRHDPREAFLARMGVSFPLAVNPGSATVTAGGEDGGVTLPTGGYAGLRQLSHMHYRLVRGEGGNQRLVEEKRRARGWLDVRDAALGMSVSLRNMWQEYPKELSFSPETGDLTAWLWPASVRLMDVRRYSDYPHSAQGESAEANNRWVERSYYGGAGAPNDPFAGTARTHEMLLCFHDGGAGTAETEAINADFQSPPLVYSGYERYRSAGITVPLPDMDKFPNVAANLDNYTNFWLFHQRYWGWFGLWNHGDFQHRFRGGGYGEKTAPENLAAYLRTPAGERAGFQDHGRLVTDYRPQQDWLFDNGRWGWTNTEGLPGLYFQQEYLRTGRRDVFFAGEALARHARDVVTRQSGQFFGKGTRHGVQHWSDGNHEERQTTFAEYRLHYYLTGEGRSRDVMMKLSDYYARGRVRRADHSGRIPGLFTRWEMTGDPAFEALVRDYLHTMVVPEGFSGYADLNLAADGVRVNDLAEGVNTRNMFFQNFGALYGIVEYYQATGDEVLRDALVRSARATFGSGDPLQQGSASMGLLAGFAALHDRADGMLRENIIKDMSDPGTGSRDAFMMVSANPLHWTGETAWLSRQSPLCWFYMVNLPVVLAAAGEEPQLPAQVSARFREANERPRPEEQRNPYYPRLSWQDEFDAPELGDYFAPWRPVEAEAGGRNP